MGVDGLDTRRTGSNLVGTNLFPQPSSGIERWRRDPTRVCRKGGVVEGRPPRGVSEGGESDGLDLELEPTSSVLTFSGERVPNGGSGNRKILPRRCRRLYRCQFGGGDDSNGINKSHHVDERLDVGGSRAWVYSARTTLWKE